MRRFLILAAVLVAGCGDHILGPVQTVDGTWSGTHNGFAISLTMAQSDTVVFGNGTVSGVAGSADVVITGTFKYPNLDVFLGGSEVSEPAEYTATMSQTQAKLFGHLNGGGFTNMEFDMAKK